MKKWLKKSFVALITLVTFGLVTPYQSMEAASEHLDKSDKDDVIESKSVEQRQAFEYELFEETRESIRTNFLNQVYVMGESQAWKKFGEKIGPVIEDEFQDIILPKIETAIEEVTNQFDDEDLQFLSISQTPGKGKSEKIFHIYNEKTGKDIIRFHVRRDLRPLEGYWFNFHYHTYHDNFQSHHELGDIYWDKNTPPHWAN
ncbi:YpjP family protein [Caldibacillus lycopersici]|uniref:YpjP family protein n=1 Tax=Perspicuibacillus lycopersici TaxID=1325689 RepID=A0AAE3IUH0_9BACI|nr:YpjP family protein [Perspicuibacillus lycopersici]MCU9613639.1 YpjP family protein [Perspicuibacillus lycopersici]